MSILDDRTHSRLASAPHTLQDQLIAKVDHLLAERRKRVQAVAVERRGRNPQRKGYESHDQDDVNLALGGD